MSRTEYNRKYYRKNRERLMGRQRGWHREHPEQNRLHCANYYRRKHGLPELKSIAEINNETRRIESDSDYILENQADPHKIQFYKSRGWRPATVASLFNLSLETVLNHWGTVC